MAADRFYGTTAFDRGDGLLLGGVHGHGPAGKGAGSLPQKAARSLTSWFKRGLRFLLRAAMALLPIPKPWAFADCVRW